MLTEEGIKSLLPPPRNQTAQVTTEPPVLETPTTTLPAGVVRSTNPPVQNSGDRAIFDPADMVNYSNVTLPASTIDAATSAPVTPLESQIPREITIPEPETKPPNTNFAIIISVAVALAIIALVAFFTMRRSPGNGAGSSKPATAAPVRANLGGGAAAASPSLNT
jgi:hypothetical protein